MAEKLRLQAALAQLGFASRRGSACLIKAGRVKVKGKLILQPGYRVSLNQDDITVDNKNSCIQKKVYYLLNKPKGVTSTVKDRFAEKTVLDLLNSRQDARIYPVGRLDKDTTGLLLLTNDGELTYRLSHPKFEIKRVYRVNVQGAPSPETLSRLEKGVLVDGQKTFPCKINLVSCAKNNCLLEIELREGRKRQIKKMFSLVKHPVTALTRIAFGPLKLAGLKVGQWRRLNDEEVKQLKELTLRKEGRSQ